MGVNKELEELIVPILNSKKLQERGLYKTEIKVKVLEQGDHQQLQVKAIPTLLQLLHPDQSGNNLSNKINKH
jgi:hypothetical protein